MTYWASLLVENFIVISTTIISTTLHSQNVGDSNLVGSSVYSATGKQASLSRNLFGPLFSFLLDAFSKPVLWLFMFNAFFADSFPRAFAGFSFVLWATNNIHLTHCVSRHFDSGHCLKLAMLAVLVITDETLTGMQIVLNILGAPSALQAITSESSPGKSIVTMQDGETVQDVLNKLQLEHLIFAGVQLDKGLNGFELLNLVEGTAAILAREALAESQQRLATAEALLEQERAARRSRSRRRRVVAEPWSRTPETGP